MKLGQKLAVNYLRGRLNLLAVVSKKKAAAKAFNIFCTPFYRSRKKAPPIFAKATPQSVSIKGITVHGFKWNKGGSKRILIVHGFESTCKNYDAFIKALVKKNYEVLAFDAPGHGISGGKQITLPLYIEMIEAIYYTFGGIQGFVAHSFGGLATLLFAEKIKDNGGMQLALIAPLTSTHAAIDSFFKFLQLNEGVRAEFEKILESKSGKPSSWFSLPRAIPQIKGSVLYAQDTDDIITPIKAVEPIITAQYPNVEFFITEGLGHKRIYRDTRVIQKVVEFF